MEDDLGRMALWPISSSKSSSIYLEGVNEENHKNSQTEIPVTEPRFDP
jgi:hypothetical protein